MLRRKSLVAALTVLLGMAGNAQTPAPNDVAAPTFRVQVWGYLDAEFSARVSRYFELRQTLQKGERALVVSDDPAEIRRARRTLAKRIQAARRLARQGDIFTPPVAAAFKSALLLEMTPAMWAAVMDDNPGEFSHDINGIYPGGKPFSTVPGQILAALPSLPDDIQYRFVGRHLVLFDVRAGVIVDRIPYAIQCANCDERDDEH